MQKTALISGITGQDGSYLAELLLAKGYRVHGIVRRASNFNTQRIDHLFHDPDNRPDLHLSYGDLCDRGSISGILNEAKPDEIYNLAAQSHVRVSFDMPEFTADVVATGTLHLLEAIRRYVDSTKRDVRYYQAGSSEMFGAAAPPQDEATPFHPRSPYAASKVAAHWYSINYRESYGLFICNGILFNHESPRRGETFVTRKVTRAVARIKLGLQDKLYLGNLEAKRDWGFAGDYVESMWRMLQHDVPDDYVVATGESYSVKEFVDRTFALAELDPDEYVVIDPRYFRPAEVDFLQGDASKARQVLGWAPKVSFDELVQMMYESDLATARNERLLVDAGQLQPIAWSR